MGQKIGFVGAGNMAEAIIGAVIRSELFLPEQVSASDIRADRLDYLKKTYRIAQCRDNSLLFSTCDIVFLAIKPQHMNEVLATIATDPAYQVNNRKLIVSIAAGVKIEKIEAALYAPLATDARKLLPIIRVMPNTPALVLKGISGMSPNIHTNAEDLETARSILASMGKVIQFEEIYLDAVTALSGSGPAYVFYLTELMIQAGVELGLAPEDAKTLAITTVEGAAALLSQGDEAPETLRRKVTSPGGTTEAAIAHMTTNGVSEHIVAAIIAAADRSRELSK